MFCKKNKIFAFCFLVYFFLVFSSVYSCEIKSKEFYQTNDLDVEFNNFPFDDSETYYVNPDYPLVAKFVIDTSSGNCPSDIENLEVFKNNNQGTLRAADEVEKISNEEIALIFINRQLFRYIPGQEYKSDFEGSKITRGGSYSAPFKIDDTFPSIVFNITNKDKVYNFGDEIIISQLSISDGLSGIKSIEYCAGINCKTNNSYGRNTPSVIEGSTTDIASDFNKTHLEIEENPLVSPGEFYSSSITVTAVDHAGNSNSYSIPIDVDVDDLKPLGGTANFFYEDKNKFVLDFAYTVKDSSFRKGIPSKAICIDFSVFNPSKDNVCNAEDPRGDISPTFNDIIYITLDVSGEVLLPVTLTDSDGKITTLNWTIESRKDEIPIKITPIMEIKNGENFFINPKINDSKKLILEMEDDFSIDEDSMVFTIGSYKVSGELFYGDNEQGEYSACSGSIKEKKCEVDVYSYFETADESYLSNDERMVSFEVTDFSNKRSSIEFQVIVDNESPEYVRGGVYEDGQFFDNDKIYTQNDIVDFKIIFKERNFDYDNFKDNIVSDFGEFSSIASKTPDCFKIEDEITYECIFEDVSIDFGGISQDGVMDKAKFTIKDKAKNELKIEKNISIFTRSESKISPFESPVMELATGELTRSLFDGGGMLNIPLSISFSKETGREKFEFVKIVIAKDEEGKTDCGFNNEKDRSRSSKMLFENIAIYPGNIHRNTFTYGGGVNDVGFGSVTSSGNRKFYIRGEMSYEGDYTSEIPDELDTFSCSFNIYFKDTTRYYVEPQRISSSVGITFNSLYEYALLQEFVENWARDSAVVTEFANTANTIKTILDTSRTICSITTPVKTIMESVRSLGILLCNIPPTSKAGDSLISISSKTNTFLNPVPLGEGQPIKGILSTMCSVLACTSDWMTNGDFKSIFSDIMEDFIPTSAMCGP